MEKAKVLRNLEKLVNRDFGFINAGRIAVVADNKKINTDLIESICKILNIETNHIEKNDLKEIIKEIKIELGYLDEEEIPKLKRLD